MKKIKFNLRGMRLSVQKIVIILMFAGIFLGILFANLFGKTLVGQLTDDYADIFIKFKDVELNYLSLLQYVIFHNFKLFLLIIIFSLTVLGIPYIIYFLAKQGFYFGFLISVMTMLYGPKGLLLFIGYIFPQYLIYLPLFWLLCVRCWNLSKSMYFATRLNTKGKMNLITERIPLFLLLAVILFIGSILETYVNSNFLKGILGFFSA